jgi:hypothetical protein
MYVSWKIGTNPFHDLIFNTTYYLNESDEVDFFSKELNIIYY